MIFLFARVVSFFFKPNYSSWGLEPLVASCSNNFAALENKVQES